MNRRSFISSIGAITATVAVPSGWLYWYQRGPHGPSDVLLMRHAEEPDKGPHLDDRGRERAASLIKLFPARFPRPTALFATRTTKGSSRPVETLEPLAAALDLTIDEQFSEERSTELASFLQNSRAAAGGHVVICWHHGTMQRLARALGVSDPPAWPETVYDHVWFIKYANGSARLSDESERLLPADK